MRSFVKIKSLRNGEITLSTTHKCKPYPSREMFRSQVCLLTLFAKIKFSRKFPDLQYLMDMPVIREKSFAFSYLDLLGRKTY